MGKLNGCKDWSIVNYYSWTNINKWRWRWTGQFEPRMILNLEENKAHNEITHLHLKMKYQGEKGVWLEYYLNTWILWIKILALYSNEKLNSSEIFVIMLSQYIKVMHSLVCNVRYWQSMLTVTWKWHFILAKIPSIALILILIKTQF